MFISKHAQEFTVRYLCQKLQVSKSGFYAWANREEPQRAKENGELLQVIEKTYLESGETYGSPRIYKALMNLGYQVGKNRVEKLMRQAGLRARSVKVYRRITGLHKFFKKFPNLRLNLPKPSGIDQQWAADLTYLKLGSQWRYLAVVLDLYSRKIVGWSFGKNKDTKLTKAALMFALRNRKPKPGLVFHTDRGSEYLCSDYQLVNERYGIQPSMNRPGKCTDNAEVESFFHSMKSDIIKGNVFAREEDLKSTVAGYIQHFYNRVRLHSSLDFLSPVQFEAI